MLSSSFPLTVTSFHEKYPIQIRGSRGLNFTWTSNFKCRSQINLSIIQIIRHSHCIVANSIVIPRLRPVLMYTGIRSSRNVALHCTYMSVLTCSFTVCSVCFRTSPANVSIHFSLEMHLEHSYHCVVFLSVHSSNSTLVLFCLVTLSKPSFSSITTALPGSSLFAPTRARAKTTISIFGYLAQTFEVLQHVCSIENHQQQEEAIQAFQVF